MPEVYTNIYQKARKTALLTQEQAAEQLDISVESVKAYELGGRMPPNATVAHMVDLYGTPWLAMAHLQEAAAPLDVLPPVKVQGLSTATLDLIDKATALSDEYRMLIRIAADGRIDETEIRDFEGIKAAILDVIRAGYQVIYTDDSGIKKNRPEAGTSERLMSDNFRCTNDCKAIIADRRPVSRANVSPKGGAHA
jgi:transcriptional regulator with XRE-family HTH domain